MSFYNHRAAFIALLGEKCEECGENRPQTLSLAPRRASERRKINILLRMKKIDLEPLREDFHLLCFNCKAIWESEYPELRERKKESIEKSRSKWAKEHKKGVKKQELTEEKEKEPLIQNPDQELFIELKSLAQKPTKSISDMAKRRLKLEFGLDLP